MKSFLFGLLFLSTSSALAKSPICVVAEIKDFAPTNYVQKIINLDEINEFETTDGTFKAKIIFQEELNGLSLNLRYKDISIGSFFDFKSETTVLSINADQRTGQINCWR